LKIKAFAGLPAKKAKTKTHMNQQLAIAMGFIAGPAPAELFCRNATQILCISGRWQTNIFLWFRSKKA
jgi:hypothetical protein